MSVVDAKTQLVLLASVSRSVASLTSRDQHCMTPATSDMQDAHIVRRLSPPWLMCVGESHTEQPSSVLPVSQAELTTVVPAGRQAVPGPCFSPSPKPPHPLTTFN